MSASWMVRGPTPTAGPPAAPDPELDPLPPPLPPPELDPDHVPGFEDPELPGLLVESCPSPEPLLLPHAAIVASGASTNSKDDRRDSVMANSSSRAKARGVSQEPNHRPRRGVGGGGGRASAASARTPPSPLAQGDAHRGTFRPAAQVRVSV